MLIRQQGRVIKLLRLEAVPGTGLTHQVPVGIFRADDGVPSQLLSQLTHKERRTLSEWLGAYQEKQARAKARPVLTRAQSQLEAIVAALDVAADTLSPADADILWNQLRALAGALRRGGHPKPVAPRRQPAPLPGQRDLVDELVNRSSSTSLPV